MRQLFLILLLLSFTTLCFAQTYVLNGNAQALGGNCYAVTPSINFQNGTVWYSEQINLSNPFDISFYMNFGANDFNGADGMVFVLQQIGVNALGINGSGMGFQGFNNSFGIEFDTYSNNADPTTGQNMNDPLFDHVAFLRNGDVNHASANNIAGPVQASATSQNIEDNQDHIIRITWNPVTDVVELYFDCVLRISQAVNLTGQIFTSSPFVYFGFTGSTGGLNNFQTVCLDTEIIAEDESFTVCEGESIELTTPGNPAGNFTWSPATFLDDANIQNPTATPTSDIIYTVTFEDLCGNPFTKQVELIIAETPSINAGMDEEICDGESIQLNATASDFSSVLWATADGNIVNGANSLTPTINESGTYIFTVNYGIDCSISDEIIVNSIAIPNIELTGDLEICEGENTTVSLNATYDSVEWSTDETSNSITVSGGNYNVTVMTDGCTNSENFTIVEIPLPAIELGPDLVICENETATLNAGAIVNWSTGETAQSIVVNTAGVYEATIENQGCSAIDDITVSVDLLLPTNLGDDQTICENETATITSTSVGLWNTGETSNSIEVSQPGLYSITVENGACLSTESVEVIVADLPNVELGDPFTFCNGRFAVLNAFDDEADSYLWSTGETSSNIDVYAAGVYSVEVINSCGSAFDTITVFTEECDYFLYVPNAFTPDNDGTNDVWHVSAFNLDAIEIFIFNRWGDLIFYSNDASVPWLGDDLKNGYYVPNGVYSYVIEYTVNSVDRKKQQGTICLLR